jgi:F0F1-type ATP synthase assembly protein I
MTRPGSAAQDGGPGEPRGGQNESWSVFGYLISGMAVYGGIGWIAGRLTHLSFLFPVGMLTGLILGIVLILYRYGKA